MERYSTSGVPPDERVTCCTFDLEHVDVTTLYVQDDVTTLQKGAVSVIVGSLGFRPCILI